jgi:hypothetical protein
MLFIMGIVIYMAVMTAVGSFIIDKVNEKDVHDLWD